MTETEPIEPIPYFKEQIQESCDSSQTMVLRICWEGRNKPVEAEERLTRLRRVLQAALETKQYQSRCNAAELQLAQIEEMAWIEAVLEKLPQLPLRDFRSAVGNFGNPAALRPQPFRSPYKPVPKTAVLMPGFEQCGNVKVFPSRWSRRLERFQPQVIAAPVVVLRRLAGGIRAGARSMPSLTHAVVPFLSLEQGPLSDEDHELFWRFFQVPVFEQYLGFDGRLIAWECEAHDGLHIVEENGIFEACDSATGLLFTSLSDLRRPTIRLETGLEGTITTLVCECGVTGSRIVGLRRRRPQQRFELKAEIAASACA